MSKSLLDCVHFVKKLRAELPELDSANPDGFAARRDARRIAIEKMVAAIGAELPKVKIRERWDGAGVSIAGVRASSTQGIDQALANWVAGAYRKLDIQSVANMVTRL
jgi:hypothetical protein